MQQFCQYGSVRGATGNRRPYRDDGFCGEMPRAQSGDFGATPHRKRPLNAA